MKQLLVFLIFILFFSCSNTEEGFLGEWEGIAERINDKGNLIEVDIECNIKSLNSNDRSIELKVGGAIYNFEAKEELDVLVYKDYPLNSDSSVISYVSGTAEILYDSILRFDHLVYALKHNALLFSDSEILEMKRK